MATYKNLSSIGVGFFKQQLGITSFELIINPNTGKKFCTADTGFTFKAEQEFDSTKPAVILVDTSNPDDVQYTLINKRETATVVATF